ncbi:MAG: HDIG domain-containing protein [Chloroflexi bacterium]|nr:HDIG domain-containing protein [Chloroflexota bacterium]
MEQSVIESKGQPKDSSFVRILIFSTVVIASFALLSLQISIRKTSYSLQIGDVATQEILAPRTITYQSKILTDQAKNDAESMVSAVYLPADPTISRNQVLYMRSSYQFMSVVRGDAYATREQKIDDIQKLNLVRLDELTIGEVLDLSDEDWLLVQSESQRILEQIMQNSIREDRVNQELESIPTMIDYQIDPKLTDLIENLTRRFVVPNSIYSAELTEERKIEARDSILPRERTFVTNQIVVSRGQIITELIFEALDEMGLVYSKNDDRKIISAGLLVIGLSLFALLFFTSGKRHRELNLRACLLMGGLYLAYLFSARLFIPNRAVVPFIFPMASLGFTIASLNGSLYGMMISIIIGLLVPYDFQYAITYATYYIITSLVGIIVLKKARQTSSFFWAGLASGIIGIPIVIGYHLTTKGTDMVGALTLSAASLSSGLLSTGMTIIFQYLFSKFVGVATSLQLMEIIRPDSPLLQMILNTAPGTYQHSLMVANLAEQGAKAINADPLLVRAGAMYHDVGKALNPSFFVENQISENLNLHEDITPKDSAKMIIQHVYDGVSLVKKYQLPEVIVNFVLEHHGTNVTRYQLNRAEMENDEDEELDLSDFTYPGPKPRSKETALVMLADTCEARARADRPRNDDEIEHLIKDVIDYYSTNGQLDLTPLTLFDLTKIRESFTRVLRNTYHPRMKYPEDNRKKSVSKKNDPVVQDTGQIVTKTETGAQATASEKQQEIL